MPIEFPEYRVGDSKSLGAVAVFPLFAAASDGVDYLLAEEAIGAKSVIVKEVSEEGSVPELAVENKADTRVLFLEGEELVGAKQNRVLNTSVLVGAGNKIRIPVTCVEQGRWRLRSRNLATSGSYSTAKIRFAVKQSVARSLKARRGHSSDQTTVWQEVDELQTSHGVASSTYAMSDVYEAHRERLAELQEGLSYVDGAIGMAVAVGGQVVALELFGKPSTCQKVWRGMLAGYAFDAPQATGKRPASGDVEELLQAAREAAWEAVEAVGEGEEYRTKLDGSRGSALCFQGSLVHGSIGVAA